MYEASGQCSQIIMSELLEGAMVRLSAGVGDDEDGLTFLVIDRTWGWAEA